MIKSARKAKVKKQDLEMSKRGLIGPATGYDYEHKFFPANICDVCGLSKEEIKAEEK